MASDVAVTGADHRRVEFRLCEVLDVFGDDLRVFDLVVIVTSMALILTLLLPHAIVKTVPAFHDFESVNRVKFSWPEALWDRLFHLRLTGVGSVCFSSRDYL